MLISDLQSDGLLDKTLIVAQGEFGRTVGGVNGGQGRDHYPQQSVLFAGYGDDRTLSDRDRLEKTGRQFFVKLSYAFQR